jgi:cytochrome P450
MPESCPYSFDDLMRGDPGLYRRPQLTLDQEHRRPLWWSEEGQFFVVDSLELCGEVSADAVLFSSRYSDGPNALEVHHEVLRRAAADDRMALAVRDRGYGTTENLSVLSTADPPAHTRQRRIVMSAFGNRQVKVMEDFIRKTVKQLVDRIAGQQRVDLLRALAVPLPLAVIAHALGAGQDDVDLFEKWSDDFMLATANPHPSDDEYEAMKETRVEFDSYMLAIIDQRATEPKDDLIQAILDDNAASDAPLSLDELLWAFKILLVGGNETTSKQLANALVMLAEDESLQRRLIEHPELIAGFAEEAIRLEPSVQGFFKYATADTELAGTAVPKGSLLLLHSMAANRDPARFSTPDDIDVERGLRGTRHFTFSQGAHYCPGAGLARAEVRIALEVLFARLGQFTFDSDRGRDELDYPPNFISHGPRSVPVKFVQGAATS